jgi:membrane protein required for colicin V production
MHSFDIIVIIFTSLFIAFGIKRGFIEEVFHLIAMVGGFIGAYLTYPAIFDFIIFIKISDQAKTIISFILAYIVIAASIIIIGWVLKKIVHFVLLGWLDRILGGIIGFTKAAIIIWIFTLSICLLPPSKLKNAFLSSETYKFLTNFPIELSIPKNKKYEQTETIPLSDKKDTPI